MAKDNQATGLTHSALTAETSIVGKIVSRKDIRIDGILEGGLECEGKVIIGEQGKVIGDIVAVNAEIMGRVTGNVLVAEMLILKSTSYLEGDIQARKLSIEPHATLNGKCTMLQSEENGRDAEG